MKLFHKIPLFFKGMLPLLDVSQIQPQLSFILIVESTDLYYTIVATVQPWGKVLDSGLASGNYSWGETQLKSV